MVSRERPRKQITRSSTKSALKMSMAIIDGSSLIFSPKHVTARTPPVGTPSSGQNSSECVLDSAVSEILGMSSIEGAYIET